MTSQQGTGKKGIFISVEGGDGCGKSTQLKLLFETLSQRGITVLQTREPGGTPEAEQLRHMILTGSADRWDATEELMLFSTARRNHTRNLIRPALERGEWVLSDRYLDSTTVYQGHGRGYDMARINTLHELATEGLRPDLTLIFDIDPAIGVTRSMARRGNTEVRFENLDTAFHERVRAGFLAVARAEPQRCAVIDASGTIPEVQQRVWDVVSKRLGL